jgi:acyl-CoA synthetase (AMP-forming)/AMP-acid ligase II
MLPAASPVITQTSTDDLIELRVSTVGQRLPGVEARIVNPETNAEVPPGTQGEVVCRGYNVMKGYYRMPEATAQAIDGDGWLHSGDLGTMDAAGDFKITVKGDVGSEATFVSVDSASSRGRRQPRSTDARAARIQPSTKDIPTTHGGSRSRSACERERIVLPPPGELENVQAVLADATGSRYQ